MSLTRYALDRRSLLLGAGALSLAGCAGAPRAASDVAALLPRTQAVLDRYVAESRLPGATAGLRLPDGQAVFLQAGTLDYGASPAVDRNSLFRIYSMTKPVTGAAAALLVEDGLLTLDQPVTDFIPEFARLTVAIDPANSLDSQPVQNTMTIRHLLTHTAGFTYNIVGDGPVQRAYRRAGVLPFTGELGAQPGDAPRARDLDEMAARLADIPLLAEPGTAFNYSISLDVLGLVIQRASGLAFPDFIQRRLLDPIGMNDTVWRLRPGDRARLAAVHDYSSAEPQAVAGASADLYSAPITLFAGGAGLVSSTRDYLAFLSVLLDEGRAGRVRVMRPETARLIQTNILPAGVVFEGPGGYGFGGYVARPEAPNAGEYGWSGAAGTVAWINPATRVAGVIMAQFFPYGSIPIATETRLAIAQDLLAAV